MSENWVSELKDCQPLSIHRKIKLILVYHLSISIQLKLIEIVTELRPGESKTDKKRKSQKRVTFDLSEAKGNDRLYELESKVWAFL